MAICIGHAKSIALNFGIAHEFAGRCHLRFDDTNPTKEEQEYIDSILADVHWLGYDWGTDLFTRRTISIGYTNGPRASSRMVTPTSMT